MRSRLLPSLLLLMLFANASRAEHAKVTLDVESKGEKKTAFVDQTPPEVGKNPRPILKVKKGDPIKIQWMFTNIYPHKTLENVVIHFYIAPQKKVGLKEVPTIGEDVVFESAFEMDFKPGAKAGGRQTLSIPTPGIYLIRVESRQTQSDHEHFGAIDLVVE
jgi:hypothetical protein